MNSGQYRPYSMAQVRAASAARTFSAISMFANIGGSSLGYSLAGGRVVLANEKNAKAARVYAVNFPATLIDTRDVRQITASRDNTLEFIARAGLEPTALDILDGSPPCGPYSPVGPGLGRYARATRNGVGQQDATAALMFDFVRMARVVLPKVVIGENVPALVVRHRPLFNSVMHALRTGDDNRRLYFADWAILSAADYGVPQKRKRLVFIGIRKDVAETIGVDDDHMIQTLFPAPTHTAVSIRDAFVDLQQSREDIEPWYRALMVHRSLGHIVRMLPPDPTRLLWPHNMGIAELAFSLVRCAWNLPAPTLTSLGSRPNGLGGALHPDQDRKFTVPEQKRLHGMPDDFAFACTIDQAAARMGLMVPPLLAKAVAQSVVDRVLRPYADQK